jgi:hypothetical protein
MVVQAAKVRPETMLRTIQGVHFMARYGEELQV